MKTLLGVVVVVSFLFSGEATYGFPGGGKEVKVIRRTESSSRSWLGVSVKDVTSEQVKELGLKKTEGAYVSDVMKKSPAESAGIKEGDVVVEFDGRQIYDADGLVNAVKKTDVGSKVKVTVVRKGDRKDLYATLEKQPKRRVNFAFAPPEIERRIRIFKGPSIGLNLIPLNPQLGKYFEAPDGKGLLVEKVEEGSAADKAGFKAGDVITKIGDKPVSKLHELRSELAEYEEGDKVNIEILRKASRKTLTVKVEKDEEEGYDFSIGEFDTPDFDVEVPEIESLRHFDFNFDELRPELHKLQRELNRLKERIGERLKHRLIRDERAMPEI